MIQVPLILLTAVDLRRSDKPGTSRAISISKFAIPSVKFMTAGHNPGGGVGEVNFTIPRIEALEPKFDGKGIDTDIFNGLGEVQRWTFAGAYRDKKTNKDIAGRGIIEGAITDWEPDESDPSDFQGCSHGFNEVTHFELTLGDEEIWYFDFWERELRPMGKSIFASVKTALGA